MGGALRNSQVESVLLVGRFLQDAMVEIYGESPSEMMITIGHVDRLMGRYDRSKPFSLVPFAECAVLYMIEIGAPRTARRLEHWALGCGVVDRDAGGGSL